MPYTNKKIHWFRCVDFAGISVQSIVLKLNVSGLRHTYIYIMNAANEQKSQNCNL